MTDEGTFKLDKELWVALSLKNTINDVNKKAKIPDPTPETHTEYFCKDAIKRIFTFGNQSKPHQLITDMFDINIPALRKLDKDKESQYFKDLEFMIIIGLDLNDYMHSEFFAKFNESPNYPYKI